MAHVRHTLSYDSVPDARPLHASTHLSLLSVSPHKPGEVDAALSRPYLTANQHNAQNGRTLKNDTKNERRGNEPQEGSGNSEQNVGPKQVHREWNDVQYPVNVSQTENSFQTVMCDGIAHIFRQPRSKQPR